MAIYRPRIEKERLGDRFVILIDEDDTLRAFACLSNQLGESICRITSPKAPAASLTLAAKLSSSDDSIEDGERSSTMTGYLRGTFSGERESPLKSSRLPEK